MVICLSGCAKNVSVLGNDDTMEIEAKQAETVLAAYYADGADIEYDNAQEKCRDFVPNGAEVLSLSAIQEVVYIDYMMQDVRYIVGYRTDGSIEKSMRKGREIVTLIRDKNGKITKETGKAAR